MKLYKAFNLISIQVKTTAFFTEFNHQTSITSLELSLYADIFQNALYQTGKRAIEREFQAVLLQHSRPLMPVDIANILGINEDPGMT